MLFDRKIKCQRTPIRAAVVREVWKVGGRCSRGGGPVQGRRCSEMKRSITVQTELWPQQCQRALEPEAAFHNCVCFSDQALTWFLYSAPNVLPKAVNLAKP